MDEIRNELLKLADDKYRNFNKSLCPDTNRKMLGIRIPQIRKLALKIIKEYDWRMWVKNESNEEFFEEVILEGFVIAYSKVDFEEKIPYIENFIPKIDSWEISDTFVPTLKLKEKDLEKAWKFILPYTKSQNEFDVRFAVIMMLDYFITENYVDRIIKELDEIKHDGYYAKMGVAWCLAEIGIKFNDKAMNYLKSKNNLDKFTYNKTLQKMIESRRITSKQKDILRSMKI